MPRTDLLTEGLWACRPLFEAVDRLLGRPPAQLARLIERTAGAQGPLPEPLEIDLVVTWVDGEAPDRRRLRERYAASERGQARDATAPHRFRDNGELRYLLRSVSRFAPWVRQVFVVVSDGQRPAWVRPHPRLHFVEDTELFARAEHLPTFNSHALECNLHRIPNLAEHYLYCNDDMMFGRPVVPEDFVDPRSGALKLYFTRGLSPAPPTHPGCNAHNNAWRSTNRVLNQRFGAEQRPYPCHGPTVLRRSLAHQAEQAFSSEFQATMGRRFRHPDDIHPVGLQLYLALYAGAAVALPAPHSCELVRLDRWRPLLRCDLRTVARERPRMFCVNDGARPDSGNHEDLRDFLESYFPDPSEFES